MLLYVINKSFMIISTFPSFHKPSYWNWNLATRMSSKLCYANDLNKGLSSTITVNKAIELLKAFFLYSYLQCSNMSDKKLLHRRNQRQNE